jgi:hypothetical protein
VRNRIAVDGRVTSVVTIDDGRRRRQRGDTTSGTIACTIRR